MLLHFKTILQLLVCSLLFNTSLAQFDFGESCSGSGNFEQQIASGDVVKVGDIPAGLQGLRINLFSSADVDIQVAAGSTQVVQWPNGVINSAATITGEYNGDSITYSGYNGQDGNLGNEYIIFNDELDNAYTIYAFGYANGFATISYSWEDKADCNISLSGEGEFNQAVLKAQDLVVGNLPAGISDVYVRLESVRDIDIQLFDGNTPIIGYNTSPPAKISGKEFSRTSYGGLEVEYSGYNGEQRSDSFGQEYIYISGTLSKPLTLKAFGYENGNAFVKYSWGYYYTAAGKSGDSLKSALHDVIDSHTEISYTQCWEALKRADQDNSDTDNVLMLYSRLSVPKANQDKGGNTPDAWNREHVWPISHGDFGKNKGAGTDIHALRAADKSVNNVRSTKDFSEDGTQLKSSEPREDCPLCKETNDSFTPPDSVKGAVARMIFYMAVRYNGDDSSNGLTLNVVEGTGTPLGKATRSNGVIGDLSTLKEWNENYPPTIEEYRRNNIIFDIQGNRNPFIDHPEYVNEIF